MSNTTQYDGSAHLSGFTTITSLAFAVFDLSYAAVTSILMYTLAIRKYPFLQSSKTQHSLSRLHI